jgi:diacylglycerol kinase (ATP)
MENCLLIFNPTAGPGRHKRLLATLGAIRGSGTAVTVCETTAPRDADRLARTAVGCRTVIAAGGDGTINEIVNGLRAREDYCTLGLVPLGTANVLARELGIDPSSPATVAGIIGAGVARRIALGCAAGRYFTMMAGIGFDAHVVDKVDPRIKRRFGKLAYVVSSLAQLLTYRPRTYRVRLAGREEVVASVVVANGHFYGGPYVVAPDASLDVPDLQVCLFHRTGRWHALRYLWGMLSGRLARFKDFEIVSAEEVTVEAGPGCAEYEPVQGDGDIVGALPMRITVTPSALSVLVPA